MLMRFSQRGGLVQKILSDAVTNGSAGKSLADPLVVLITRYSMRTHFGAGTHLPSWLPARLRLFTEICLPSIAAQERRPDVWLIGFAEEHRSAVADVLAAVAHLPWVVPVWQAQGETVEAAFVRAITAKLSDQAHLLSIRLDSDDALGLSFIRLCLEYCAAVTECSPELCDFWIAFPFGVQVSKWRCVAMVESQPHFVARCTRRMAYDALPATVMAVNHTRLRQDGRRVFSPQTDLPIWLEFIHGDNAANRVKWRRRELRPRDEVLAVFGLVESPLQSAWQRCLRKMIESLHW